MRKCGVLVIPFLALASAPALGQSADAMGAAKTAIRHVLKDPDSARFEGMVRRPGAVCGFVNAKNAMGGYTGRRMFVYLMKEKRAYILELPSKHAEAALHAAETHCAGVPGF